MKYVPASWFAGSESLYEIPELPKSIVPKVFMKKTNTYRIWALLKKVTIPILDTTQENGLYTRCYFYKRKAAECIFQRHKITYWSDTWKWSETQNSKPMLVMFYWIQSSERFRWGLLWSDCQFFWYILKKKEFLLIVLVRLEIMVIWQVVTEK